MIAISEKSARYALIRPRSSIGASLRREYISGSDSLLTVPPELGRPRSFLPLCCGRRVVLRIDIGVVGVAFALERPSGTTRHQVKHQPEREYHDEESRDLAAPRKHQAQNGEHHADAVDHQHCLAVGQPQVQKTMVEVPAVG